VVDWCYMCKRDGESVDHLLHCEVACALWSVFFSCIGLSCVAPRRVADLCACWWTGGSVWSVVVWKMVLSCCLWWQMFRGPREDVGRAYVLIFSTLYTWTAAF